MIDLEKVKPGDVLTYRGTKCVVKKVTLERLGNMSEVMSGIQVEYLDGEGIVKRPYICPPAFSYLDYFKKNDTLNTKVRFIGRCPNTKFFIPGKVYEVVDGKITDETGHTTPSKEGEGFKDIEELNEFFDMISSFGLFLGTAQIMIFEEVNE